MVEKIVEMDENLSDDALVSLINNGDINPLSIIIDRYFPTILMYINQMCPSELKEDAIQEATLALYGAVRSYDSEKAAFSTFAGLCIKRAVVSFLKSQTRKRNIPAELLSSLDEIEIADGNSPEKIFFDRDNYKALKDSIKLELSPLEYKVLDLYIAGYRYSVIADKLGLSIKSVNNAMLRIRNKLKSK